MKGSLKPPLGGDYRIFENVSPLKCSWDEAINISARATPGRESSVARRSEGKYSGRRQMDPNRKFNLIVVRGGSIPGHGLVEVWDFVKWGLENKLLPATPIEILSAFRRPSDLALLSDTLVSVLAPGHKPMSNMRQEVFCLSRNHHGVQAQHIKGAFLRKNSVNWAAFVERVR